MNKFSSLNLILINLVCALGIFLAVPSFLPSDTQANLPSWWSPINLGLDLQGGSHLLMQVKVDAVVKERLVSLEDGIRSELRKEGILYDELGVEETQLKVKILDSARKSQALGIVKRIDNELTVDSDEDYITAYFSEPAFDKLRQIAVDRSIEIVRNRIDQLGTKEPSIQRQGDDRILIQLPGESNPKRVKDLIGRTAKMSFHLVDDRTSVSDARRGKLPPEAMLVPGGSGAHASSYVVLRRAVVGGEHLVDSRPSFQENSPVVSFSFDTTGGRKFGEATKKNVGKSLAILLDGEVISAPVIQGAIMGGSGVITGNFTIESASDLAMLLRSGALPAPLEVLEERTVGPGLGADSIKSGSIACMVGVALVVVAMIVFYGLFGVMANVALVVNLMLVIGLLALLGGTLTLPGIAGIVLTMGMAVDANVLIFERIREETKLGRSPFAAIESGFNNAMSTIVDANLTTLIASLVLFQFGTGPVRGFAVTLGFGILTTMFSAIILTRMMVSLWALKTKPKALPI